LAGEGAAAMNDEWTGEGVRITDPHELESLKYVLEEKSALIVEHRFYRGSRAPRRVVFERFEDLDRYIAGNGSPGDAFCFWSFEACCRDDNLLRSGKIPDANGRTPRGGAY
jgi:hypothetical protein